MFCSAGSEKIEKRTISEVPLLRMMENGRVFHYNFPLKTRDPKKSGLLDDPCEGFPTTKGYEKHLYPLIPQACHMCTPNNSQQASPNFTLFLSLKCFHQELVG